MNKWAVMKLQERQAWYALRWYGAEIEYRVFDTWSQAMNFALGRVLDDAMQEQIWGLR